MIQYQKIGTKHKDLFLFKMKTEGRDAAKHINYHSVQGWQTPVSPGP